MGVGQEGARSRWKLLSAGSLTFRLERGPPGEGQPGCEQFGWASGTLGSFSEQPEVGVWDSEEGSRLETRFGVEIAFEGLE